MINRAIERDLISSYNCIYTTKKEEHGVMEKQRNKWYILNLESESEPIQYLADWDMMIAFFDYLRIKDKEDRRVKAFDCWSSASLTL